MSPQVMLRHDLHSKIDALSDTAIEKLVPYVAFLSYEDCAVRSHEPNETTLAAMKESLEDRDEAITLGELQAQLDAIC